MASEGVATGKLTDTSTVSPEAWAAKMGRSRQRALRCFGAAQEQVALTLCRANWTAIAKMVNTHSRPKTPCAVRQRKFTLPTISLDRRGTSLRGAACRTTLWSKSGVNDSFSLRPSSQTARELGQFPQAKRCPTRRPRPVRSAKRKTKPRARNLLTCLDVERPRAVTTPMLTWMEKVRRGGNHAGSIDRIEHTYTTRGARAAGLGDRRGAALPQKAEPHALARFCGGVSRPSELNSSHRFRSFP